ncbi:MAG TPA: DUF4236 domain-containing protein [Sphingomicrobium sp.]|nr:DUF4236 domain-containing protein [Sphingomicrobium sp.]
MPFYIRKAFKVGPVRFNLSKSGLGASVGVTGLRVGAGPKGRYVHAGRGGLYFRKRLPSQQESDPGPAGTAAGRTESAPKDGLARWIGKLFRGR